MGDWSRAPVLGGIAKPYVTEAEAYEMCDDDKKRREQMIRKAAEAGGGLGAVAYEDEVAAPIGEDIR